MDENYQWGRSYLLTFKNPENGTIVQIDKLRMSFSAELYVNNKDNTDKGTISIYNMSDATVNLLDTRFGTMSLSVGYNGNVKQLITGDVINVQTSRSGNDKVTAFVLKPNFTDLTKTKISYSFPEEIYLGSVVKEIAKQLNLSFVDSTTGEWRQIKCQYGYPAHGTGKQVLDDIATTYGIEWKITSDNALVITDRYGFSGGEGEKTIALSPKTGMLEHPFFDTEEISKSIGQSLNKKNEVFIEIKPLKPKKDGTPRKGKKYRARRYGVRVKALINPEMRPNSLFKVETDDSTFNDLFRVRSIKFDGDTRGGDWYMEVFGDAVEGVEFA